MIRLLSFLMLCCLIVPAYSYAQEPEKSQIISPKGDFATLKHTKSGRIDKIIDGLTLLLKDGTIIRLTSLDIPDFAIWRDAPYSEAALALLQKTLPEGTDVLIYQTRMAKKGRITRMKHELAHVVTKKDDIWIQGLLLANGLARVELTPDATEMADQMLAAEKKARKEKIGIWADDSEFPILTPDNAATAIGQFAIVEGVVESTAAVRNNVYLNFGKEWKKDFTIMITPAMRKQFAHLGIDPLSFAHKPLRVRGWVREYNGPLIELDEPAHLEFPTSVESPIIAPQDDETENHKSRLKPLEESPTLPYESLTN